MLKPANRYISIKLPDQQQNMTESGIMLPEDFKPREEQYTTAEVIDWAVDVRFKELLHKGDQIVIDKSMIEEITIKNETINVVLDNYIVGIVEK